jgi:predicted signal transduction protein with EAL and GGDEF domain
MTRWRACSSRGSTGPDWAGWWDPAAPRHRPAARDRRAAHHAAGGLCRGAWIFIREASQITRELIDSEALARHVAYHDTLTGLPNRALMFDRLTNMLAIARPCLRSGQ